MSVVHSRAEELFARAQRRIAGGVSSDARRPTSPSAPPLYVDHAAGAHLWDVDGNRMIDYVLGQGPAILGHCPPAVTEAVSAQMRRGVVYSAQHEQEIEVAERMASMIPAADLVRFNTVGSEAVHAALRLARGYTGRSKVLKFEGHYHGWLDPVLYSVHPPVEAAGPADHPTLVGGTGGQPASAAGDLVLAPWNDSDALERLLAEHAGEIAAIIMEPVLCNTGAIAPAPGYLPRVRELADQHGALLIFDEVITGFRLAPGGAQEYLSVTPDLATFGKAMAGGMPVSALVGRGEVMEFITSGKVAHAGTFNSHPVAMAAAAATLKILDEERETVYPRLFSVGHRLMEGLRAAAGEAGRALLVDGPGPVFQTYLTEAEAVRDYRDFAATDRAGMVRLHDLLLDRGVNMVPRGLWFVSTAHTDDDVDATIEAFADALRAL